MFFDTFTGYAQLIVTGNNGGDTPVGQWRNIILEGNVPNLAIAQHKETLDYYATRKGELRKAFENKHYIIFQKQFENMFTFNNDNDW